MKNILCAILALAVALTACGEDDPAVTDPVLSSSISAHSSAEQESSTPASASAGTGSSVSVPGSSSAQASSASETLSSAGISSAGVSSASASIASASSSAGPVVTLLWFEVSAFGLSCEAEDDAGDEAEFFGTCDVTATTNGVSIQARDGGYPVGPRIWDVAEEYAGEWTLAVGAVRDMDRVRCFGIRSDDLVRARITVRGHVLEQDTFGSDDLGWQECVVVPDAATDTRFRLPAFTSGGTTARIEFAMRRQ